MNSDSVCVAKTCSTCREVLDVSKFGHNPQNSSGFESVCRPCRASVRKERNRQKVNGTSLDVLTIRRRSQKYKNRTDEQVAADQSYLFPDGKSKCASCQERLPLDYFYRSLGARSGIQSKCKTCQYKIARDRRTTVDADGISPYDRTLKKYRSRLSSRSAEEILTDRNRVRPDGNKYCCRCSNTLPVGSFHNNRYMLDGLSPICKDCARDRKTYLFEEYWLDNGIPLECYVCGGVWDDADHVISKKRKGPDDLYNRLPICSSCNGSKYMYPLEDWLREKHPTIADEVLHRVGVVFGVEY